MMRLMPSTLVQGERVEITEPGRPPRPGTVIGVSTTGVCVGVVDGAGRALTFFWDPTLYGGYGCNLLRMVPEA